MSSDAFFYNIGEQFWEQQSKYGPTPIQGEATLYGEGTITGIDLPGEAQGRVDSKRSGTSCTPRRPRPSRTRLVVHGRQHRDGLRPG